MWLLLNKNILDNFEISNQFTYILKIDKTNFLVGKNNSGKSYFLRFLLKNSLKIYENNEELIKDIKEIILSDKNIDLNFLSKLENEKIVEFCNLFGNYDRLLDKANSSKIDTSVRYLNGYDTKEYNYQDEEQLMNELQPLFKYLKVTPNKVELNTKIIPRYKEIKSQILRELKEIVSNSITSLDDNDIIKFGKYMNNIDVKVKIPKYYFPIFRSIRHPLKDIHNAYDENTKKDVYRERITSEYELEDDINIITGLNFYVVRTNNKNQLHVGLILIKLKNTI